MKTLQLILFTALVMTFTACDTSYNREDVLGTWQVTDFTTTAELSEVLIKTTRDMVKTNVYVFKDGSYSESSDYMGFTTESTGNWNIDLEKKTFELNMNDAGAVKTRAYVLDEFSGDKMIWKDDMGELGVNRMTLEKQ